jgi:phosphate transport system substrate-binding protein
MRTVLRLRFAFATLVIGLLTIANAATAATLRFGGTGSALGMLRQVGNEYAAASGVTVEVVPSLGSSGALHALADGKLDVVVSARPLKPKEAAAGLRLVLVLRTPFVLATSHAQPQNLRAADLPKIFEAARPLWPDGKPIRIILRPRSEADTTLLGNMYPGMVKAIESARRRAEVPIAATDQDNVALAQRVANALTGTTLTQLETEHVHLRVVAIDGVAPTLANFDSGAYRFAKKLYFVLGGKSAPAAERFISFLQSPQGVKALRAAAVLPDKR